MENFENEQLPQQLDADLSEPAFQPVCPEPESAPVQAESVYGTTPYTVHVPPQASTKEPWANYYQPVRQAPATTVSPKKKKGGFLRGLLSIVLIVILVAASAGISAYCVDRAWQRQSALLQQHFQEKIDVLQQQIDDAQAVGQPGGQLQPGVAQLTASQIYQRNVAAVVAITATKRTNQNGNIYESSSAGTGFIWTEDGYVITNCHVIDGASAVTVTLHNGQAFPAALVGFDATNDIALLRIQVVGLPTVTIGSSAAMQVGDQVVAIGNALGELSSSLTVGYVSGIDRDVSTDGSILTMIQTDAAINSGNSGGPLFNARGEVIGINTAKYSGTTGSGASIEGIGFAIPIDDVIGMLEDLKEFGYIRSAYLGIECYAVPESATIYGVPMGIYVQRAVPGFCAAKAGVQAGDIIIGLGGYDIENLNDLSKALRAYDAGETVSLVVWRSGRQVMLSVTLDEKPQN